MPHTRLCRERKELLCHRRQPPGLSLAASSSRGDGESCGGGPSGWAWEQPESTEWEGDAVAYASLLVAPSLFLRTINGLICQQSGYVMHPLFGRQGLLATNIMKTDQGFGQNISQVLNFHIYFYHF